MTAVESKRKEITMFKAKEVPPADTILKIKEILNICSITVKEHWYDSNINNIFSVRIEIDGTNYGTNGKGSSHEYALASAYGELMERIGNRAIFKAKERQLTNTSFTYFPDEFTIKADSFDRLVHNTILFNAINGISSNYEEAYKRWRSLINSQEMTCIKYKSSLDNREQIVPVNILKVYGSNGMAAGNTLEEAFVQAVSEIFERYALYQILNDGICPPVIPVNYIEREFENIYSVIMEIQQHNDLFVELRDCSFVFGFPVICVCVYNQKTHSDSISFGAHPVAEIAMERAINEAFQGRPISNITNRAYSRKREKRYNRLSILKNGMGYYPYSFYAEHSSYDFKGFKSELKYTNNAEMKQYIIDLCKTNNIEIYTHTISLYGFYVIHVIIPGMSEIIKYDEYQVNLEEMKKYISRISDLKSLTHTKHQMCLEFIDYTRKNPELWNNIIKADKNQNIEKNFLMTLFRGFMYLGKYDRAAYYNELLKPYIGFDFYSGLIIVIDMKKQGYGDAAIREFLSYYYCDEAVNDIFSFIENNYINPFYNGNTDNFISTSWLYSVSKVKEGIRVV